MAYSRVPETFCSRSRNMGCTSVGAHLPKCIPSQIMSGDKRKGKQMMTRKRVASEDSEPEFKVILKFIGFIIHLVRTVVLVLVHI